MTRILQRRDSAVGRHTRSAAVPAEACWIAGQAQRLEGEIAAYRAGYAVGFVDCVTLRSCPGFGFPTSPL